MALLPMAMYGLEVPAGDVAIMAHADIPAAFRVTMAAIDPSADPEGDDDEIARPRATLKVLRLPLGEDEDSDFDSDDEMDIEAMDAQFGESESESDEDDEEVNGGPSDPSKSKKAKVAAARQQIREMLEAEGMDVDEDEDDEDEEDEALTNGVNGVTKSKKALGKMPKSDEDEDEDDDLDISDEDDMDGAEIEEFVICTLDPEKNYQQTLDITFGENERVWFKVTGTHTIYLTGNYVEPTDPHSIFDPDSDEEDEYDLSPGEDEIDSLDEDEMDELDDMEDPRVTEIEEEEEVEAPALVKAPATKATGKAATNKNKRPAPDSADEEEPVGGVQTLDDMIAKEAKAAEPAVNGEATLSKSQRKKLKKANGAAAAAPAVVEETKVEAKKDVDAPSSNSKKVSFAAQLEQGPTPTKDSKAGEKKADKAKATLGVKTVQGVTIDDKKLGSGQAAKNGDRVSMRYIGKLASDNKVFDRNTKGKPFSFKLGSGEVIKGLEIGSQGLQAGGERRVTIPAALAYGSKRTGEIPPNSVLIFDIKMLDINKGK